MVRLEKWSFPALNLSFAPSNSLVTKNSFVPKVSSVRDTSGLYLPLGPMADGAWRWSSSTANAAIRYIKLTGFAAARKLTLQQPNVTDWLAILNVPSPVLSASHDNTHSPTAFTSLGRSLLRPRSGYTFVWDTETAFLALFCFLFLFRYLRLLVHIVSFLTHKSVPVRKSPALNVKDATVIIPSVEPSGPDFEECVCSVLANNPAQIIVVTVGQAKLDEAIRVCKALHATAIEVKAIGKANKRKQVLHALPFVKTQVTVLVDDHVFWPRQFLGHILAPFEDPRVGGVGTKKRVRRFDRGFSFADFWNFMGCVYLERHNFEIAATINIDGGVFCLSGRTSAIRTRILQQEEFVNGFGNEMILNRWGPLNADDDHYITRFLVRNDWDIKFQMQEDATMETTLGEYPKFLLQCLRWVRSTWRSHSASLFTDRAVWHRQPWSVYAIYLTSFFNFALFYDSALVFVLLRTSYGRGENCRLLLAALLLWIMASKMVKLIPHFLRCPKDLIYFPGYVLFAYFHSFLKLYAGLTFFVMTWGSRPAQVA